MYGKLPQSGGGNTLKKGMVMITIGDHIKTRDPLIEEDTLMELDDPLIEKDTLVEDPLIKMEDPWRRIPGGGPPDRDRGPPEEDTLVEDPLMEVGTP